MRINTNVSAMNTHRQYGINNAALAKSTEKLSSGYRINSAADDAAGLAISEKMRAQIRGMNQSSMNVQDGISFVQTVEGYLQTATDMVQRLNELANQAATGTLSAEDIGYINEEVTQLFEEMDKLFADSKFNGRNVFDAEWDSTSWEESELQIQAGANTKDTVTLKWSINFDVLLGAGSGANGWNINDFAKGFLAETTGNATWDATSGTWTGTSGTTYATAQAAANAAIDEFQAALDYLNSTRAQLGAYENRLEYRQANLDNAAENLSAAESRIRDVDMAKEMTEYTKQNILSQAATAMLAQANSQPQLVLQLLG